MIGLHTADVKKRIIIALCVATTMTTMIVAYGDPTACPCNDNGQYAYLASASGASRCDTTPYIINDPATKGGGISTGIGSAFGSAIVRVTNQNPTGGQPAAFCQNVVIGQPGQGGSINIVEGHVCIVEMMQACRDAGF
jgi:hypothetical protein